VFEPSPVGLFIIYQPCYSALLDLILSIILTPATVVLLMSLQHHNFQLPNLVLCQRQLMRPFGHPWSPQKKCFNLCYFVASFSPFSFNIFNVTIKDEKSKLSTVFDHRGSVQACTVYYVPIILCALIVFVSWISNSNVLLIYNKVFRLK